MIPESSIPRSWVFQVVSLLCSGVGYIGNLKLNNRFATAAIWAESD